MSTGYPVTLFNLNESLCIVVGGGLVAERKVQALLDAQARVRVIAPAITDELARAARASAIDWLARLYQPGDLADAFLVIAATDDVDVNRAVAHEAHERKLLINVVDDPAHCNYIAPAVVRRGDLTIAVSTGGAAPALAAYVRARLERQFGGEWAVLVPRMARLRERIAARVPELNARREVWRRVVDAGLDDLSAGRTEQETESRVDRILAERS
ncbi:MAG: bifunctional precorrin-2 dehydrogenase/sirohydrochlorin ferrochelatase [Chloroflexi bacterium]|nr:bifunctional precorrin-2 dehydrogenase/sirohydrochlorin ferrochelatase [Chloroflexota bacterium]